MRLAQGLGEKASKGEQAEVENDADPNLQERQQPWAFSCSQPGRTKGPRGTPPILEGLCKGGRQRWRRPFCTARLRRVSELSDAAALLH